MNENSIFAAISGALDVYSIEDLMNTKEYKDHGYKIVDCPICGWKTLDTHWICFRCGWEYDGFDEDHYSSVNNATLREYRSRYHEALKIEKGDKGG